MKKYLLLFAIICSAPVVKAQNEYLQNNPEWTIYHGFGAFMPCIEYDSIHYYLNGDSIINSLTYKQLWKCGHKWYSWMSPNPNPGCGGHITYCDTVATGFVRSQGLQMYYIPRGDTAEQLLYDFNLTVGSQLPQTYAFCCPSSELVTSIDSIYTPYGYRKRFFINNSSQEYLIEGIGSNYGLIEPWGIWLDNTWQLVCYGLNDTAWYPGQGPYCDVITSLPQQEVDRTTIEVFPNPSQGIFTVQTGADNSVVEIRNAMGELIYSSTFDLQIEIDMSEQANGIYFCSVTVGEELMHRVLSLK